MRMGVTLSVLLHMALVVFVIYGLPRFSKPYLADQVVPVEFIVLAEIEVEEPPVPEQDEPEPEEPPKPEPKPEPKPAPKPAPKPEPKPKPEPEPAPEPEPIPEPEPVPLKVEAPEPEIIQKIEQEPEPKEIVKALPAKPKTRPKPPKRPEPPKKLKPKVVTKKEEPKPKEDALTSILKNVDKLKSKPKKTTAQGQANSKPSRARASAAQINDIQRSLQQQMKRCWRIDAGAIQADEMVVEISVNLRQDGSVSGVRIVDQNRFNKDAYYRTAAENARRAIISCQPYKLPISLYNDWETVNWVFDPSKMFGQ